MSILEESFPQPDENAAANVPENLATVHNDDALPDISILEENLRKLRENLGLTNPNRPVCAISHSIEVAMDVEDTPHVGDLTKSTIEPAVVDIENTLSIDVVAQMDLVEPIDVNIQPLQNRPPWIQNIFTNMRMPMPIIEEKSDESNDDNKENQKD